MTTPSAIDPINAALVRVAMFQTHSKTSLRWTVLLPPSPQGMLSEAVSFNRWMVRDKRRGGRSSDGGRGLEDVEGGKQR